MKALALIFLLTACDQDETRLKSVRHVPDGPDVYEVQVTDHMTLTYKQLWCRKDAIELSPGVSYDDMVRINKPGCSKYLSDVIRPAEQYPK